MQHINVSDTIGMIGVGLILFAYYQLSVDKLRSHNISYQLLNLIGSFMIFYSLIFNWNTPSVVIELVWIYISCLSLWRTFKRFKAKRIG